MPFSGSTTAELCIGITSFNSAWFLGACLDSIAATTQGVSIRVLVLDNASEDDSAQVARRWGAEVHVHPCTQASALNWLFRRSRSPYTLLLHADVVFLTGGWFQICRKHLGGSCALVSPEDVGLGPFTRGFHGMPESSFLLFETAKAWKMARWYRTRRFRIHWPWRGLNFYGPHITHELPSELGARGLTWKPMEVLTAPRCHEPIYECHFTAANWRAEYATYCYGFGNFYRLDGVVTHYHNWYNRADRVSSDSQALHPTDRLPLAFFRVYGERFLQEYRAGRVQVPC